MAGLRFLEDGIGVCIAILEAQIHSAGAGASSVDDASGDFEYLSGPELKRATVSKFEFQFTFEDQETFIRAGMLMPRILSLHHGDAKAMIVDVENGEILIAFLDARRFPLEIDHF